jgi:hypothetical protein
MRKFWELLCQVLEHDKLDVLAIATPQHEGTDLPTHLVHTLPFTSSIVHSHKLFGFMSRKTALWILLQEQWELLDRMCA